MRRTALLTCSAIVCLATQLLAEQQVTLKSGAELVGEVTFDGDVVVVAIDKAQQRVPLASVASITPVNFGPNRQANRLLLSALEARLLGGSPRESTTLLAEAARLAPDDPQIAYWYASALVDSGSGKAAERVLDVHREAIDAAYPDRVAKLADRIKLRLLVEMLPTALVARVDELNAAAAVRPDEATQYPAFAAFRVLDQHNDPVPLSAFTVQCSGQDERVEEFSDGYFLVTFMRHRNHGDQPCRLRFDQYGLKSDDVEFRASSDRVALAGQFVVHRFTEGDKRPVNVRVVDRDGQPVRGARIEVEPTNQRGSSESKKFSAAVDDEGRAALAAFPGSYMLAASASGYNTARDQVQLTVEDVAGVERTLAMHREIAARIRVEWQSKSLQPGMSGTTTDEGVVDVNGGPGGQRNPALMFMQPFQLHDRLQLRINLMMYGPGFATVSGGPWLKKYSADDESDEDAIRRAAEEHFAGVDLDQADKLADEFKSVSLPIDGRGGPPGMIQAPADFGDVFVGRFIGRNPQNGQPVETTFKAIVERPGDAADAQ